MGLITLETLQQQYLQKTAVEREADEELRHLHVCEMTYQEVCVSEAGRKNSRRLVSQIKNWKKGLSQERQNSLFVFLNRDLAIAEFLEHLSQKYTGKKKAEVEDMLRQPGINNDIKNLFTILIYEHKAELEKNGTTAFFSPAACRQISLHIMLKKNRSFIHEARWAAAKAINASSGLPSQETMAIIDKIIEAKLSETVKEYMPKRVFQIRERNRRSFGEIAGGQTIELNGISS